MTNWTGRGCAFHPILIEIYVNAYQRDYARRTRKWSARAIDEAAPGSGWQGRMSCHGSRQRWRGVRRCVAVERWLERGVAACKHFEDRQPRYPPRRVVRVPSRRSQQTIPVKTAPAAAPAERWSDVACVGHIRSFLCRSRPPARNPDRPPHCGAYPHPAIASSSLPLVSRTKRPTRNRLTSAQPA